MTTQIKIILTIVLIGFLIAFGLSILAFEDNFELLLTGEINGQRGWSTINSGADRGADVSNWLPYEGLKNLEFWNINNGGQTIITWNATNTEIGSLGTYEMVFRIEQLKECRYVALGDSQFFKILLFGADYNNPKLYLGVNASTSPVQLEYKNRIGEWVSLGTIASDTWNSLSVAWDTSGGWGEANYTFNDVSTGWVETPFKITATTSNMFALMNWNGSTDCGIVYLDNINQTETAPGETFYELTGYPFNGQPNLIAPAQGDESGYVIEVNNELTFGLRTRWNLETGVWTNKYDYNNNPPFELLYFKDVFNLILEESEYELWWWNKSGNDELLATTSSIFDDITAWKQSFCDENWYCWTEFQMVEDVSTLFSSNYLNATTDVYYINVSPTFTEEDGYDFSEESVNLFTWVLKGTYNTTTDEWDYPDFNPTIIEDKLTPEEAKNIATSTWTGFEQVDIGIQIPGILETVKQIFSNPGAWLSGTLGALNPLNKVPFSWILEIRNIFNDIYMKVETGSYASSTDLGQWTIGINGNTTTIRFFNMASTIDEYGDDVAPIRTALSVPIWGGFIFYLYSRFRSFFDVSEKEEH